MNYFIRSGTSQEVPSTTEGLRPFSKVGDLLTEEVLRAWPCTAWLETAEEMREIKGEIDDAKLRHVLQSCAPGIQALEWAMNSEWASDTDLAGTIECLKSDLYEGQLNGAKTRAEAEQLLAILTFAKEKVATPSRWEKIPSRIVRVDTRAAELEISRRWLPFVAGEVKTFCSSDVDDKWVPRDYFLGGNCHRDRIEWEIVKTHEETKQSLTLQGPEGPELVCEIVTRWDYRGDTSEGRAPDVYSRKVTVHPEIEAIMSHHLAWEDDQRTLKAEQRKAEEEAERKAETERKEAAKLARYAERQRAEAEERARKEAARRARFEERQKAQVEAMKAEAKAYEAKIREEEECQARASEPLTFNPFGNL